LSDVHKLARQFLTDCLANSSLDNRLGGVGSGVVVRGDTGSPETVLATVDTTLGVKVLKLEVTVQVVDVHVDVV
jgi:hypothetical protein